MKSDRGQDLIEYTLLMTFIVLGLSAMFLASRENIAGIWTAGNAALSQPNTSGGSPVAPVASSGTCGTAGGGNSRDGDGDDR